MGRPSFGLVMIGALAACGGDMGPAGEIWTCQASPTSSWLYGVWASGEHDVYAVGSDGVILHSDNWGDGWTTQTIPPITDYPNYFWAAAGSGPNDVFVVGSFGVILHRTTGDWVQQSSGFDNYLMGVWAAAPGEVYAVGAAGTILHTMNDGSLWSPQSSGTSYRLRSVWARNPNDVYVVGGNAGFTQPGEPEWGAVILHSVDHGASWNPEPSAVTAKLSAVWGNATVTIAVGDGGVILRSTNGSTWDAVSSGTTASLTAISGDDHSFFVATDDGVLLQSIDGGKSWFVDRDGMFNFTAISVLPDGDAYVVGFGSDASHKNVGGVAHGT